LPDGRAIDYVIDSENRRVAKKVNGAVVRKWIYEDQLKPVAEFDGTGTLLARYLDGVTVKGSTSYRVVVDHLGTPRLLVSSTTGTVGQRLDFNEWGNVTADSSAGFQVIGFAGGIYDPDTGLVRFGARDYDPMVGRWTAKDPIRFDGDDSNLYRYVLDDSVNLVDPIGKAGSGPTNGPSSGSPSPGADDAVNSCPIGQFKDRRKCGGICRKKWVPELKGTYCVCTNQGGDYVCPSQCERPAVTGQP
jgi:RHS repeat-associated protein